MKGQLYIVATPIGNLADMSLRAIETLNAVDLIAAEDTRHTKGLLQHYGIKTPMQAYHEYNEQSKAQALLEQLLQGKSIALVSDAGTPLIHDPGFCLVRDARAQQINVVTIPGPCAAISALSIAGLSTDRFFFEGFLPVKSTARQKRLVVLRALETTLVIYESCHRIVACLSDIADVFGKDAQIALAKELTKQHEQVQQGSVDQVSQWLHQDAKRQLGEFVVLIAPMVQADDRLWIEAQATLYKLQEHLPLKTATKLASELTGFAKNRLYEAALKRQSLLG